MNNNYLLLLIAVLIAGFIGYQVGTPDGFSPGMHMMRDGYSMRDDDMSGMMQMMDTVLSKKSGAELDRAFLTMMIPHHQGAISMCEPLLQRGERNELKDLCRDIAESQSREIILMREWLSTWY